MNRARASLALATSLPVYLTIGAALAQDSEPVRIDRDGLKLEMAPLGPDPVQAFFLARGFSEGDARHVVETACLFRSAIGNAETAAGTPEVTVSLSEWRVMPSGGEPKAPEVRENWEAVWKARGVAEDASTAFYWSLFPTEQTFHPNDYNWGFLTFGLPAGTVFDLKVVWRSGAIDHEATIKGLRCAK